MVAALAAAVLLVLTAGRRGIGLLRSESERGGRDRRTAQDDADREAHAARKAEKEARDLAITYHIPTETMVSHSNDRGPSIVFSPMPNSRTFCASR